MAGNLKRSHDGYLFVDHRASPGLPADMAIAAGYDPDQVREGKVYEAPTLGCAHCGTHVIINPWRTRERGWCAKCDRYICEGCEAARKAGAVHRTIEEISDMVNTGRWTLAGHMSTPILNRAGG